MSQPFCCTPLLSSKVIGLIASVFLFFVGFTTSAWSDISLLPGKKKDKEEKELNKQDEKRREQWSGLVPEVKPAQVSFVAGRSVDVVLEVATSSLAGIRFVVREEPKNGKLSNWREDPTNRQRVIVTYTPNDKSDLKDQFSYACKVGDSPFSAAAVVELVGRATQPRLEVTKQPLFERVLPGSESMGKFAVTNSGLGEFSSEMDWPAPFRGPPRLELAVGETLELAVFVTPRHPGVLSDAVILQPGQEASRVRLWVQCEEPFVLTPSRAELDFDEVRGSRQARIRMANASKLPIRLQLTLPERLHGPSEVLIQPNQLAEVDFSLHGEDVEAFRGEVLVTDGNLEQRLALNALATPARVELASPSAGGIKFGRIEKEQTGVAKIRVINRGGQTALLSIQAPPPFRVPEEEQSLSVSPGVMRELVIEVMSERTGRYTGSVVLLGGSHRIEVPVEAVFVDPTLPELGASDNSSSARPVVKNNNSTIQPRPNLRPQAVPPAIADPADLPPERSTDARAKVGPPMDEFEKPVTMIGELSEGAASKLAELSMFGIGLPPSWTSKRFEKIDRIELLDRTTDELELAWPHPNPDAPPQGYRVEFSQQVYVPKARMFFRHWVPWESVEQIAPKGGRDGVRVKDLQPGSQYELRLMAIDETGRMSPPSDILIVSTAPPWRFPIEGWYLMALVALGALLLVARRLYLQRMGLLKA